MGVIDTNFVRCPQCEEIDGWDQTDQASVGDKEELNPATYVCRNCGHHMDGHEMEYHLQEVEREAAEHITRPDE